MAKITAPENATDVGEVSMTEYVQFHPFLIDSHGGNRDDHYYRIQSEKSQILNEKETVEKVYQALLEEHVKLQSSFDDIVSEKDDALSRLNDAHLESDTKRNDKSDGQMRDEIHRLRGDL